MQKKSFREDINGLRAIAVLSVVIFHFNKDYLPGGFAGVDVFFVISGYLMTSIIFRGIENNNFSILNFIKSRAKRIIPALTVVISLLLVIGFLFFEPSTYKVIGKHSLSSLLFVSNYVYSIESGYFDIDSGSKFLLHTWSLSVEWQFYILYPIVLYSISKILALDTTRKIIIVITVLSFFASIILTKSMPQSSYFLIYTRSWEMTLGGIAYIYPLKNNATHRKLLEIIGLSLIVVSFFIFSDSTMWPSYNAIIPVLGAYLCILANNKNTIVNNIILQKIGIWSYSIYLIHWPLYVFLKKTSHINNIFILLFITVFLSYILYINVESKRKYGIKFIIFYLSVVVFSAFISKNGAAFRIGGNDVPNYHLSFYGGKGIESKGKAVRYNNDKEVEIILVGDSLARQYANYFHEYGVGFVGIFRDGCFSSKKYYTVYDPSLKEQCQLRYKSLEKTIKEYPSANVIIAQRWDEKILLKKVDNDNVSDRKTIDIIDDYISEISHLTNGSSSVYVIGLLQGTSENLFECNDKNKLPFYKIFDTINCASKEKSKSITINDRMADISKRYNNVTFVNIKNEICNNSECNIIDKNGMPIYSDSIHLSVYGAKEIGESILNKIK